jgi:hypothetical protein
VRCLDFPVGRDFDGFQTLSWWTPNDAELRKYYYCVQVILDLINNDNRHSEGAERLKNPYSDLVGCDLRDTSAPFHFASV